MRNIILRKKIERLKNQPEMQAVAAYFRLGECGSIGRVKNRFPRDGKRAFVGRFQKIEAPQKGGFSAPGRTDNGKNLAFLQGKGDAL